MDVEDYGKGCTARQQNEHNGMKFFGTSQTLQSPQRQWGSIAMDFITHLSVTKGGFPCKATFVDRFSKSIYVVTSCGTDTADDVADVFF